MMSKKQPWWLNVYSKISSNASQTRMLVCSHPYSWRLVPRYDGTWAAKTGRVSQLGLHVILCD